MRGRKPKPTALKIAAGNPGKRRLNPHEPKPVTAIPSCPAHLSAAARQEWRRIARHLHDLKIISELDRSVLAGYCQAWGRWVEAEQKLKETPPLLKTPSGYVQPSPWLSISNKNLELMHKFMSELGLTPASRSRVCAMPLGGTPSKFGDLLRPRPWEFGRENDRDEDPPERYVS